MATANPLRAPGLPPSNRPSVATSRKRSRSLIFREDGEQDDQLRTEGTADDHLKRMRTTDDLEALGLIPTSEAWQLPALTTNLVAAADAAAAPNGLKNYVPGRSLVVLCVLEHVDIHYRLLCSILPHLHHLSPTLLPLLLTRHTPSSLLPDLSPPPPPSLTLLPTRGPPHNHLLNLGLLQPLGGGQAGMDALVVLDACGARRLVLPVGWGVGRHVAESVVQERLVECLVGVVEGLEREMVMP